jgi:hypothetical protein
LLPLREVLKNLNTPMVRIDYKHAVVAIDKQTSRQLKFSEPRTLLPEVIEKLSLAVEDLHHPTQPIDHVEVPL